MESHSSKNKVCGNRRTQYSHPNVVILSAAWTSRSEVHAESKDPYTFHRAASVSGNSHDTLG